MVSGNGMEWHIFKLDRIGCLWLSWYLWALASLYYVQWPLFYNFCLLLFLLFFFIFNILLTISLTTSLSRSLSFTVSAFLFILLWLIAVLVFFCLCDVIYFSSFCAHTSHIAFQLIFTNREKYSVHGAFGTLSAFGAVWTRFMIYIYFLSLIQFIDLCLCLCVCWK